MLSTSFFVLILISGIAKSAKILGVFPVPAFSHQSVSRPIWRELSLRGHQVTVMTPNPIKDPTLVNLTEIDTSYVYELQEKIDDISKKMSFKEIADLTFFKKMPLYESQIQHPQVQKILENANNDTFDLVIVDSTVPFVIGFGAKLGCAVIVINSLPVLPNTYTQVFPYYLVHIAAGKSLMSRLSLAINYVFWYAYYYDSVLPFHDQYYKKYFGEEVPQLSEMRSNVSFYIETSHLLFSINYPLFPNMIKVNGLHLKSKKPLPLNLQKYLDESNDGVVYFSLGSSAKGKNMSPERRNLFIETFAELPYKVVWKFENESILGHISENVYVQKWFPQQDVLGHKNIKLFITQGGQQSLEEAVNSTVPMLILPLFADQMFNANKVKNLGIGIHLDYDRLSKDELKNAIVEVINNPQYKENILRIAEIMKDESQTGLDKAVYWIEYVIKHKGARFLRNDDILLNSTWYTFLCLDLLLLLITLLVAMIYIGYLISKYIYQSLMHLSTLNRNNKSQDKTD